jgi:hypothetical protein
MRDRIGEVYYDDGEDAYYQVKYGGDFDGGMIGYVLQDVDGEDSLIMDNTLSGFDHIPDDEVPDSVGFPEPTVSPNK